MAFELATIPIVSASVGTGIKASLKKIRGAQAKLSISITGKAFKQLGWSNNDRIVIQIGTGEHHGLIRIQKNNSKGQATYSVREAVRGGAYGTLSLGHQTAFVDRAEPARWCQWETLEEGVVEIVLPKWADETGKTRARQTTAASQTPPQYRKTEDVTARLMGDPEPGRSALAERTR